MHIKYQMPQIQINPLNTLINIILIIITSGHTTPSSLGYIICGCTKTNLEARNYQTAVNLRAKGVITPWLSVLGKAKF